jgi:hypothetical protein
MGEIIGHELADTALAPVRSLVINDANLPATAEELRDVLAVSGRFFERGGPVRIVNSDIGAPLSARQLTTHSVVREAHRLCQPVKMGLDGGRVPVTLPYSVANMYLDMAGEWDLPPLVGFSAAPLLADDGSVRSNHGYDHVTGLWCCEIPPLKLADRPCFADAEAALKLLREMFQTFPFNDAPRCRAPSLDFEITDIRNPPGRDESTFLVALLTAVCRPSLALAPGMLVTAPAMSGAGSGKGLLVRAICCIAFGKSPGAFTTGGDRQELEKRLAAELVEAQPTLFLDNANQIALRSDLLASVLTERPVRVRLLGKTRMVQLNTTAFVAVTGNGLTVTEDLTRRFILCELDARREDPESRSFPGGFIADIECARAELLAALLTIWRWGRQNSAGLSPGKPLGSFETWARWCRDPLLALGCYDPVERIETVKAKDPHRELIAELFCTWWEEHGSVPIKADQLGRSVKAIADPQGRGRQYLATFLSGLAGTCAAGFVLSRQKPAGKWNAATYALAEAQPADY